MSFDKKSYFDEIFKPLLQTLASKARFQQATKPKAALFYPSNNTPTAIIVTDSGIVKSKHSAVLEKAISYARHGGTVIFRDELNQFFHSHWDLPWEFGDYQRTTVYINPHARLVHKVRFPAAYSQKAVFLRNVPADAALYLPIEDLVTESLVFPSRPVTNRMHMPVAFAAVGEGSLGYVGDTNTEEASYAVIVAMCRL
ncbi:hypothetical protein EMCG_08018 [[Emmonsia] crescens]|uniref:Uncharacterized protein n=1 Tax=[Emmonsia] crescens TaxID=73230 RepID=A0A0G2I6I7_9EURO|nr:hypothetical protein EMCG_08018 [Emmonsia crescens UAMH 3008]